MKMRGTERGWSDTDRGNELNWTELNCTELNGPNAGVTANTEMGGAESPFN